eukprot:1570039-Pleurochrysis_carterae.AAC.1
MSNRTNSISKEKTNLVDGHSVRTTVKLCGIKHVANITKVKASVPRTLRHQESQSESSKLPSQPGLCVVFRHHIKMINCANDSKSTKIFPVRSSWDSHNHKPESKHSFEQTELIARSCTLSALQTSQN